MNRSFSHLHIMGFLATVSVAACSGGPIAVDSGGTDATDSPVLNDALANDTSARDAPADVASDAGACGPASGVCNAVTNVGTVVTPTCSTTTAPTMTGGSIVDGTYVLVSGIVYAPDCSVVPITPGGPTTFVLTGGCMQSIDVTGGPQSYTYATAGNVLNLSRTCPGPLSASLQYTATGTTLSELAPYGTGAQIVSVFQKQ